MGKSKWRGNRIHFDEQQKQWLFSEDGLSVKDFPKRPCGNCKRNNTPEGHDGCIGTLSGVINACCGHGSNEEAYIQFDNGKEIRGINAVFYIERRKERRIKWEKKQLVKNI